MKRTTLFLMGLLMSVTLANSQEQLKGSNNTLKTGRDLIGSSAHFNFYADPDLANYWDSIQIPLEDQFTMFSGLLDFGGGIDSLFTDSMVFDIILYNSHEELDDEYAYDLYDWKCGFWDVPSNSLSLCVPQTQLQVDFYSDFSSLAVNTFSQLVIKLNIIRRGQNYFPQYFREGVGLYYSGFRPDPATLDSYVIALGSTPIISDLEDITNIATSGLKDLIVSNIQFQAISSITTRYMNPGYNENLWQNFIPIYYQNEESERMRLQLITDNFDFYCIDKDVQYLVDMANSLENQCANNQINYEMNFNHRFTISILPYTETWDALTHWGPANGASAYGNENFFISSFDFCYDSDFDSYLNSLIPHEYGHITHSHMYWDIPSGFYPEGMGSFIPGEPLDPNTNNDEWRINQVFNLYMSTYGRLPTFDEFVENPNNDIDPYFFGWAFCSFIHDYYGGRLSLKTFFNAGMDFESLNTTEESIEYYYIKYLEYVRDWVPNCPDAVFEANITSGIAGLEVQFTDLSTPGLNPITEWYWEFGDGTTSTEQNPIHTYPETGYYSVYMTASDGDLYDFDFKTDYIIVYETNIAPVITDWEPQALSHEIVSYSMMSFSVIAMDPNGEDLYYTWFINNDEQDETSSEFSWYFNELGSYNIKCSVSDGELADEINWTVLVSTVGIDDVIQNELELYPNPCDNNLSLKITEPIGKYNLFIFNVNGLEIICNYDLIDQSPNISLNGINAGIYFIIIESNNKIIRKKFIKK
ncbi:MAG: PKD domain-containing protein [Bacteroidota bacterium]